MLKQLTRSGYQNKCACLLDEKSGNIRRTNEKLQRSKYLCWASSCPTKAKMEIFLLYVPSCLNICSTWWHNSLVGTRIRASGLSLFSLSCGKLSKAENGWCTAGLKQKQKPKIQAVSNTCLRELKPWAIFVRWERRRLRFSQSLFSHVLVYLGPLVLMECKRTTKFRTTYSIQLSGPKGYICQRTKTHTTNTEHTHTERERERRRRRRRRRRREEQKERQILAQVLGAKIHTWTKLLKFAHPR